MTMFGRTSPVSPLPVEIPKSSAASCDQCETSQQAGAFGVDSGPLAASLLVYCLSCGTSWLAATPTKVVEPVETTNDTDEARARRASLAHEPAMPAVVASDVEQLAISA